MGIIGRGQMTLLDMNDVIASPMPPENPTNGALWFNTEEQMLYIYENGEWVFSADGLSIGGRNYARNTSGVSEIPSNGEENFPWYLYDIDYSQLRGKTITITFDAQCTTDTGTYRAQFNDPPWDIIGTITTAHQDVRRITKTVTLPEDTTLNPTMVGFRLDGVTGNLLISNFKLEIGNKATDWTPAPEDIEGVVSDITETLGNMANDNLINFQERQIVKDRLSDILGYVISDSETVLPTIESLDSSKKGSFYTVRQSALNAGILSTNTYFSNVATQYNNLKTYLESLTPITTWDVSGQNKDINIEVDKEVFRQIWLQYYLSVNELANATAEKLKENVDNVKVGGRNFALLTGGAQFNESNITKWNYQGASYSKPSDTSDWLSMKILEAGVGVATGFYTKKNTNMFLKAGEAYIISFDAYLDSTSPSESVILNYLYLMSDIVETGVTSSYAITSFIPEEDRILTKTEKRFIWYINLPNNLSTRTNIAPLIASMNFALDDIMHIKNIKLERGTKPTDWSPAPEDIEQELTDLDSRITEAELKIEPDAIIATVQTTITQAVDNVKVGGTNLVNGSQTTDGWIAWYSTSELSIGRFNDGSIGIKNDMDDYLTNPRIRMVQQLNNYTSLVNGQTYTFSFIVKGSAELTRLELLGYRIDSDGSYEWVDFPSVNLSDLPIYDASEGSRLYTHTFVANRTAGVRMSMGFGLGNIGISNDTWAMFGRIKVEKGNKATDWNPSSGDVNTSIKDAVNDLDIGGRNYILNTGSDKFTTDNWLEYNSADCDVYRVGDYLAVKKVSDIDRVAIGINSITQNPNVSVIAGQPYTISFEGYLDNANVLDSLTMDYVYVMSSGENTGNFAISASGWGDMIITKNPTRMSLTFTIPTTNSYPIRNPIGVLIGLRGLTNGEIAYFKDIQLEKGEKATDFRVAPEDIQEDIDLMSVRINNAEIKIEDDSIVNTVMSSTTFSNILDGKANTEDLGNLATKDELTDTEANLQKYTDDAIANMDLSPYVQHTELEQTVNSFNFKFSQSGGVNMVKNSIGYADLSFWESAYADGATTVTAVRNNALEVLGFGSGFYFPPDGVNKGIHQYINVAENQPITLSWYINKLTGSPSGASSYTFFVQMQELIDDAWVTTKSQSTTELITDGYLYQYYTHTPTTNRIRLRFISYADVEAFVTGVMLNIGDTPLQWTMAQGEVYNANVKIDVNGIKVLNSAYDGYTQITPEEFAGYAEVDGQMEKVFTLNKDTTEMSKAKIDNEISMSPIKIIPLKSGIYNGWAFVKSTE